MGAAAEEEEEEAISASTADSRTPWSSSQSLSLSSGETEGGGEEEEEEAAAALRATAACSRVGEALTPVAVVEVGVVSEVVVVEGFSRLEGELKPAFPLFDAAAGASGEDPL